MEKIRPVSVKAVIHDGRGRILLQKRDDDAAIIEPGRWGLFGGLVEAGETPENALTRELHEELGSRVGDIERELYRTERGPFGIINVIYLVPCTEAADSFTLHEGQAFGWFGLDELVGLPVSVLISRHLSQILRALAKTNGATESRLEQALLKRCNLRKKNDRVYYATGAPAGMDLQSMILMKELAAYRDLPLCRVCLHASDNEPIHEMLMMHTRPQLVGPLKQNKSSLSYHMLDGAADIRLYDEQGACLQYMHLDSDDSFCRCSLRLDANVFRSMKTVTPYAIFLEVAGGPFKDDDTVWFD